MNKKHLFVTLGLILASALLISACAPSQEVSGNEPCVEVSDQNIKDNMAAADASAIAFVSYTDSDIKLAAVQAMGDGIITIDRVCSNGPGWIVIHADENGAPGSLVGYAAVQDGENMDVMVQVNSAAATETLHAMLHTDAGEIGTYEFPGDDTPVSLDGSVVMMPFSLSGMMEEMDPSLEVSDQAIENGNVSVDMVYSSGLGWIVIHADDNGSPGPVIGYAAVQDGETLDVMVEVDEDAATQTLFAMLHTDAGQEGTYEFPGDDAPVSVDGNIVVMPFSVTGMMEEEMAPDVINVSMENFQFVPAEITITAGTTVVWTNNDAGVLHTATAGMRGNPTGLFDASLNPGETFSFTFEEAGTYDYYCIPHPGMDGLVIVE